MELGSTRIKAVTIDGAFKPVSSGDYTWASTYENGIWTYPLEEVWTGLKSALSGVQDRGEITAAGVSALKIGMDILAEEGVAIDSLTGHGGLFKTPVVGQSYMAAACGAPVTCMETAGEGGPYGMALLASFLLNRREGECLEDFLSQKVFAGVSGSTIRPDPACVEGFNSYIKRYKALLDVEKAAVGIL